MSTRPSNKTRSIVREVGVRVFIMLIYIYSCYQIEGHPWLTMTQKKQIHHLIRKEEAKSRRELKSKRISKNRVRRKQHRTFRN